jgi:anti-sigma regulatory factor (Ser/Thr protein kinase)
VTSPAPAGLIHQVLLYESPQQFLAGAGPFIQDGLSRGEPILAVTTQRNSSLLRDSLGGSVDGVEFVDQATWYDTPGRALAACHRYMRERIDNHERVRLIGEPLWAGRDALEMVEWKRFEATMNVAFARRPAWLLCSYDSSTLPAEVVADARRFHPQLSGGSANDSYLDPAAFSAEYDRALPPAPEGGFAALGFDADPAPVRDFVAVHGTRSGLNGARLDDLVLAANEIATNAIRHGAGHGRVRVWREGPWVLCEVTDPGDADDGMLGCLPPDPDADNGHGLWIARQLCDLLQIRTRQPGTTVRMYMRVRRPRVSPD